MDGRMYRDSSGRALAEYEHPSVAVDTALLSLDPDAGLVVLQVRRANGPGWALPGTFLHNGETLAKAVNRSLRDKANVRGLHPRQLHVFDDPDRDDRGWVLSVAHIEIAPLHRLKSRFVSSSRLMPVTARVPLPWDHRKIIDRAVKHIRARYIAEPDPDGLLGDEFTMRELRLAHEAVAGETLMRDAFRRTMERHLDETGATRDGIRGRPAELYRRKKSATVRP